MATSEPKAQSSTPELVKPIAPPGEPPPKSVIPPTPGEVITSLTTGVSYIMGNPLGEGSFGVVYECVDDWNNELAAKVHKPTRSYEEVRASAQAEVGKLSALRHPHITYLFDAFEFRDTFYIITERCQWSISDFLRMDWFKGPIWLNAVARSLLQAVHFLHLNQYAHQDIHVGNVFALMARDEMDPSNSKSTQFRLGDLGVAKIFSEIAPENTRAPWMLPPEIFVPSDFGTPDYRVDIYHCGLLFLQLAYSKELRFTKEETLAGKPRQMALELPAPLNFALEKALRRHVSKRTDTAKELWRDLKSPGPAGETEVIEELKLPFPLEATPEAPAKEEVDQKHKS